MHFLENRIPPPVVMMVFGVIMWGLSKFDQLLMLEATLQLSLLVSFIAAGAIIALVAMVNFRLAKTTVNPLQPDQASTLVVSGVFRYSRNPMYLALVFFLIAFALYLSSLWASLGIVGFILYINVFQIKPEERILTARFGQAYLDYCDRVRRWI
ncbi:isoprenylcysteine carboxylmethyltransferase family protein [Thalassotalea aquiviva]|uniref:methyltransferase family protein n=1 Tax=Thalassotalea aquiviva TaxID=3242415 RepID=UPI00352AB276